MWFLFRQIYIEIYTDLWNIVFHPNSMSFSPFRIRLAVISYTLLVHSFIQTVLHLLVTYCCVTDLSQTWWSESTIIMLLPLLVSKAQKFWKGSDGWFWFKVLIWFQVRWWLEGGEDRAGAAGGWGSAGGMQLGTSFSSYCFRASSSGLIWTAKARCITMYNLVSEVTQYQFYSILLDISQKKCPSPLQDWRCGD